MTGRPSTAILTVGSQPFALAVNQITNKIYVANGSTATSPSSLTSRRNNSANHGHQPLTGNVTSGPAPTFDFAASSTFAPTAPPVDALYYQLTPGREDGLRPIQQALPATSARRQRSRLGPLSFMPTRPMAGCDFNYRGFGSSPIISSISAYLFTALPPATSTTLSADVNPVWRAFGHVHRCGGDGSLKLNGSDRNGNIQ